MPKANIECILILRQEFNIITRYSQNRWVMRLKKNIGVEID